MQTVGEEYLIILDMPGQIELYTHVPVVPALVSHLRGELSINLCATYLLESTFIVDPAKFFAGTLSAMSAMVMLELPHVNIMSKVDLIKGTVSKNQLSRFIEPDASLMDDELAQPFDLMQLERSKHEDPSSAESVMGGVSFARLNRSVARLIDDFGMVSFHKLDAQKESSVGAILSFIDDAIQFHEAQEPKEPNDEIEYDYGDD